MRCLLFCVFLRIYDFEQYRNKIYIEYLYLFVYICFIIMFFFQIRNLDERLYI